VKKALAKIEVVKKLAYPKSKHLKDKPYLERGCIKCDTKYLTQELNEDELDFCPNHKDLRFCETCEDIFNKDEGKESNNGLWYCDEHLEYRCLECDEQMDYNQKFCSKECNDEYYIDLNDYRND